ncbi:HAD family hydrolase [Pseudomonas tolaasii]|uniref:HAD family hydrolase n=1 Tax=Pseudomonas tolaasii TaxID=29442 RepID=UPI002734FF54|nr:HAD family hydrolase [Pseudomonas tolaasii]WLH51297.1 HAD family hydrolase [Pseudomonas tolaasii]
MEYTGVIFDAFGTLLEIKSGLHPYRQLLREGIRHGRRPRSDDVMSILTFNGGLAEIAEHLEIQIRSQRLSEIEVDLECEVANIEAFSDALEAVAYLHQHGLRVGVCSNLAQPYGQAVRRLFPALDANTFSFEAGVAKPHPALYEIACNALGGNAGQALDVERVVMIGDSLRCDCHGPRVIGMRGVHLQRSPPGKISSLIDFARLVIRG